MIINHNMNALNAHRMMTGNTAQSGKSMEKLSSGLRINRAGDDAAGLAISEKMRGQIRGLNQAQRNSQDAISMVQTAEGALNETQNILQRMRELSVQSASDTNTSEDRGAIQDEINQLTSEINRIGNTTQFNEMNLLDGTKSAAKSKGAKTVMKAGDVTVNMGKGITWTNDKFEVTSDGTDKGIKFADSGDFNFSTLDESKTNTIEIAKNEAKGTFDVTFHGVDGDGDKLDIEAKQMVLDGDVYKFDNNGVTFQIAKSEFDKVADGSKVELDLVAGATASVNVTTANQGVQNDWTNFGDATDATKQVSLDGNKITIQDSEKRLEGASTIKITGVGDMSAATGNIVVEILDANGDSLTKETFTDGSALQNTSLNYDANGISFKLDIGSAMTNEGFELNMNIGTEEKSVGTEDATATFQVGANKDQSMSLSFDDMRSKALGIVGEGAGFSAAANVTDGTNSTSVEKALDLTTQKGANNAIKALDSALKTVSKERAKYGSVQNRLEHTINNLGTSAENLTAAESRIRDVDMAKEMMEFSKNNILQQASQAMLAQAKQAPQGVLQLLR